MLHQVLFLTCLQAVMGVQDTDSYLLEMKRSEGNSLFDTHLMWCENNTAEYNGHFDIIMENAMYNSSWVPEAIYIRQRVNWCTHVLNMFMTPTGTPKLNVSVFFV